MSLELCLDLVRQGSSDNPTQAVNLFCVRPDLKHPISKTKSCGLDKLMSYTFDVVKDPKLF